MLHTVAADDPRMDEDITNRMYYDEEDQTIWLADVGEGTREELSQVEKGDNLQWPYMEGSIPSDTFSAPDSIIGLLSHMSFLTSPFSSLLSLLSFLHLLSPLSYLLSSLFSPLSSL